MEHDAREGAPFSPVDGGATALSGNEPANSGPAPNSNLAVGSRTGIDNKSVDPVVDMDAQMVHSPVPESAILSESDHDASQFADFERASWLPAHPLITDPQRHIGTVFGAYRVLELLGKGGMGYVYRAEHVKLGRSVALKLLRTDYGARKDAISRFFREAKTVNRIRHRNIVDVTDFVELGDGTAFIIMELLQGQSFGKWARSGVDLPRALAVLVQICDGLGAAHSVGVIHRDLKPDNIVVIPTADGTELVKLLDFGVAKLTRRHDGDASYDTQVGALVGTPAYMSPEQAGGMTIDHRSDIYSLGTLMYELFCNQPMFRGRSFGEYVRKHLTEIPTLPRSTQGGAAMPIALEEIIMRCLAKDPNARYDNSFKLRDDLLGVLANIGRIDTRPPEMTTTRGTAPARPLAIAAASLPSSAPNQSRVSHRSWMIAGGLIAGGIIGGALWMTGNDESPKHVISAEPIPTARVDEPVRARGPARTQAHASAQDSSRDQDTGDQDSSRDQESSATEKPAKHTLVELRFNSVPSGSVFAAGHAAELCRTPCAFNVDMRDSESTNTRTFIVRSAGYREQAITVDLNSAQREFQVALERGAPAKSSAKSQPAPARVASDNDGPPPVPARATRSEKSVSKRSRQANRDSDADSAFTTSPESEDFGPPSAGDQTPAPADYIPPPRATSSDPPASPTQGIAPSDTHNPFQRRP